MLRQVAARWVALRETPVQFIDAAITRLGNPASNRGIPDSIELILGRSEQPLIVGTPEQAAEQMSRVTAIDVLIAGRFVMSRERAEELRDVLNTAMQQYDDRATKAGEEYQR